MTRLAGPVARFARLVAVASTVTSVASAQTTAAPAAPAPAQTGAPHSPFGTIAGVVIDSLHGRALSGAQVSVEGLPSLALTDSLGRFRIDSVPPGKYRIGVFHPLLDSLDLSIASPQLSVGADSTLVVKFGTPSTVTLLRLLCGEIQIDTMNGIGPSMVIGRVLDAESEAPVPNMHVTVSWTDIQAGATIGLRRIQRTRDTTTGPTGEFRFCHLPAQLSGVARASNGTGDSSSAVSRPLALGGRLVVALVLHVPSPAKPATGSHGSASSSTSAPSSPAVSSPAA